MKLYVYDHCPFCVKARMIFGLKKIPVEMITLLNDDETTPIQLIGKKMLPILQLEDGTAIGESLDIISFIDQLQGARVISEIDHPELETWLDTVQRYSNKLIAPITAETDYAEFATATAKSYYTKKKQAMLGDFTILKTQRSVLIAQLNEDFKKLAALIPNVESPEYAVSLSDLHLFPLLRALTLFTELNWPPAVAQYRDVLAKQTAIPLLNYLAK